MILVTGDGFKLKAETCSIFCLLKVLYKAVLLSLYCLIYLTSIYQSLWFSVGKCSDYV